MVTLKDVAALANVSLSTVSIIVNGKALERNISLATQERVNHAIMQLGYQPNAAARRLRYSLENRPRIMLFWPFDIRTSMIYSLLTGINQQLEKIQFDCELVIQTYKNDRIEQSSKDLLTNTYNGIIVGGATTVDIEFLENLNTQIPIVLINRDSKKLSTVCVEATEIAKAAVSMLLHENVKQVAIVSSKSHFSASNQRIKEFARQCKAEKIQILPENFLTAPNSYEGGIAVAEEYLKLENKADTIFCESDVIALGMIYYFNIKGIRVPQEVRLISIGTLDAEQTQYCTPSITIISVPSEKIAGAAIDILAEKIYSKNSLLAIQKIVTPELYIRSSFPVKSN